MAWRLARHHLAALDAPDSVALSRRLCGLQAQVLSSAAQAVALRSTAHPAPGGSTTAADPLADHLRSGRLVRTWAMRGTLHLLSPQDAGTWLSLLGSARTWVKPSWQKAFLPVDQVEALARVVHDLLADGRAATREELVAALDEDSGSAAIAEHVASSWGAALKPLAWQGLIVQGPPRGTRTTFVRPDVTVPGWSPPLDLETAAGRAIPAYLSAFGPATPDAFDAWLLRGATPRKRLRSWFAETSEPLADVEVDGRACLAREEDVEALGADEPGDVVRLLPAFDQFVLGPGTGDPHVVPSAHRGEVSRAAGWIAPVVVTLDGVVGTWRADGDQVSVELFPDSPAPRAAALAEEVQRVSAVLRTLRAQDPSE